MTKVRRWEGLATCVGVALAAGCMGHERGAGMAPEQANVASAQESSEKALSDAAEAQRRAQVAQERAERAHQAVLDERQRLTQAEADFRAAQLAAEDAQARARERSQVAATEGRDSQQRALEAQRTENDLRTKQSRDFHTSRADVTGHQQLSGTLTRAGSDSVEIQSPDRRQVSLAIDDDTDVRLDGRPASADQLPEGADVHAAYDFRAGKATAARIDVTTPSPAAQLPAQ